MKKIATYILLITLVLSRLADLIITELIRHKHKAFNELNPVYLKTGSVFAMHIYAVCAAIFMIFLFIFIYHKKPYITIRYMIFLLIFIGAFMSSAVSIDNYNVYKLPLDNPIVSVQLPVEQLEEIAKTEYKPNERNINLITLFLFCVLSFALFNRIEEENYGKTKTTNNG